MAAWPTHHTAPHRMFFLTLLQLPLRKMRAAATPRPPQEEELPGCISIPWEHTDTAAGVSSFPKLGSRGCSATLSANSCKEQREGWGSPQSPYPLLLSLSSTEIQAAHIFFTGYFSTRRWSARTPTCFTWKTKERPT